VHRTYDNGAPGSLILSYASLPMMLTHTYSVNDVCVHPNQGELISCDQAGCIKQWDLSENLCSHELVRQFHLYSFDFLTYKHKTPAGDVPIRSVSLASDGSCLVAGNNKAWLQWLRRASAQHSVIRANAMSGRLTKRNLNSRDTRP